MSYAYEIYLPIEKLIDEQRYELAEVSLKSIQTEDAHWHFLYSLILLHKAWFDSAKSHLEKAITLAPNCIAYQETLTKLMSRHRPYGDPYYNSPHYRRRSGCCCCCGDGCCDFNCCDLICLDTCCECMGGDLISCI